MQKKITYSICTFFETAFGENEHVAFISVMNVHIKYKYPHQSTVELVTHRVVVNSVRNRILDKERFSPSRLLSFSYMHYKHLYEAL